jgi:RNA polymerase sigma-70 factor (ECF subfamily)
LTRGQIHEDQGSRLPTHHRDHVSPLTERKEKEDAGGIGLEYLDRLYSYAVVLTHNHAQAEDLVQETYVRAMQAAGKLYPNSDAKARLFTILRNVWLNQVGQVRNDTELITRGPGPRLADSITEPAKSSRDIYVCKLEAERIQAAFQKLPRKFREVVMLRDFEDLSYQKIASVLDCSVETVISRLGRARAKLRELLLSIDGNEAHV